LAFLVAHTFRFTIRVALSSQGKIDNMQSF